MTRTSALVVSLFLALGIAPAAADERPIVVELFTAQGCSSCPPADALLAALARRPEVLALSLHVDYWDRLGWKDPYSSPVVTRRQRRYAELLRLATVYTPQIVVDGKWQAVGSDRADVERAIEAARHDHEEVPISLVLERGHARIKLGPASDRAASVVLIGFDRRHVTAIERGENGGRTLEYVDVVRGIDELARFDGQESEIEAPIPWRSDRIAAVVQAQDGRVLGVAIRDAEPL